VEHCACAGLVVVVLLRRLLHMCWEQCLHNNNQLLVA
jgi:hypothetical protein